jgi:integrase
MLWEVEDDLITEYMEWLAAKGNKEPTIDKKVGALRALFNFGKKQKYVSGDNPAAERNLQTRQQKVTSGHKFYELDELKQVMGCVEFKKLAEGEDMNFYLIAVAALITGVRISALASLTLGNLRTSVDGTPYLNVQKDKTAAGRRNVPIPQDLYDFMKAYLTKHESFGFDERGDGKGSSDPVRKALNKHLDAIKMDSKGFTIHGLRKTMNGCLFHDDVDIETRCQFMGHEIANVNSAVYVPGQPLQKLTIDELGKEVLPTQNRLLKLIGIV